MMLYFLIKKIYKILMISTLVFLCKVNLNTVKLRSQLYREILSYTCMYRKMTDLNENKNYLNYKRNERYLLTNTELSK